jgi:Spy/CpxP family protein refolding chaperone
MYMKKMLVALMFLALTTRVAVAAEANPEKYLELLRSDLRTQKVAVVTKAMDLSQENGDKFWPLYREYEQKLAKINDRRIANIKAYGENYDKITNEKAAELIKSAMKINRDRFNLQEDYYKKVAKATSTVIGARFLQIESVVNNLVDLQIGLDLPLVPKLTPAPAEKK